MGGFLGSIGIDIGSGWSTQEIFGKDAAPTIDAGIAIGLAYWTGGLSTGAATYTTAIATYAAPVAKMYAYSKSMQAINSWQNGPSGGASAPSATGAARAQGILLNETSNVDPIPVVYGTRKVGGSRILCETSGAANEYLHIIIALCEGEINAVTNIYLDDVLSTDAKYSGLVTTEVFLGTDSQAASAALIAEIPTKWTVDHKGSGVAYVYVKCKYSQSVFSNLPAITCDVQGRKVYDPRTSTTAYSNNPALCIRDYLTSTRYGRGISTALVDDAAIIEAADYCDELVAIPGGTQKRYTCDGVVDVSNTAFDNIKSLLTACRGMLVYSGGSYRLVLDKPETAGFAFTEDNITGSWSISQPGRRSKYNRCTASFFNPASNWQPDYGISESTAFRAQDNALLLEAKIDTPFTADKYRAQQLAGLHLKQSRFGLTVQFTALPEALRCEVGDVVSLTHSTTGWVAKLFRVMQLSLKEEGEVDVSLSEYDATVYNLDTLTAVTSTPQVSLPNPLAIAAPGAVAVTESLYQTTGSAGVKTRADVSWAEVSNVFATGYSLEYQINGASTWTTLPTVKDTSLSISDLAPGIYNFRLRVTGVMQSLSAYSPTTTKELMGLTAPPADVAGFSVTKVGGMAVGAWNLSGDLDVRIGGRIVIRHSLQTSAATWQDGVVLEEFNGDAVSGLLPLVNGTYMAKAKDSTGTYSSNMVSFTATEGMVTGFTTLATLTQEPLFAGAKSSLVVSAANLQLDSALMWDSFTGDMDTWAYLDSYGPLNLTGTYDFDNYIDLTTVGTRRVEASIKMYGSDTGSFVDSKTDLMDTWNDLDGAVVNDTDATVYYAATDDDPAGTPVWGAWTPFFVADVTSRAIKFKVDVVTASVTHQAQISNLTVRVKQ